VAFFGINMTAKERCF